MSSSVAQTSVGLMTGFTNYSGDLQQVHFETATAHLAYGLNVSHQLSTNLSRIYLEGWQGFILTRSLNITMNGMSCNHWGQKDSILPSTLSVVLTRSGR